MFLSSNMKAIKLLLIEDDEDDFVLTRDLLDELVEGQYTLDWASSATEGEAELAKNEHDVCLMDYRLGEDDGLSLLKKAPALGFTSPIIMLTGQDDTEVDTSALKGGAVDYLVKSQLNGARLARAIRYAVARREVEREQLERLRVEAESRSKSEFLAHLSHELRTPLTAILGYTDILLHRSASKKDESDLQTIKRNGQHLLSLLNDVLDLSKIAAGRLEINMQTVDLNSFLAELRSLMEVAAKEKKLSLRFVAHKPLPRSIHTDPIRLRQILINLIGNAIKFTERGYVEVKIQVPDPARSHIQFAVRDTGVGIDSRDIEKLFQPFSQGDGNRFSADQGTGLGLTISKQLAARLGGDIKVSSQPGQGSTFILSIEAGPLNDAEFAPLAMTSRPAPDVDQLRIRISGHVLVVDDLPDIRHLIGEIMSNAGARVSYAGDGEESIHRVAEFCRADDPLDLIIMDMQMPAIDGLTASKKLREQGCEIPILALTAATMQGEKERCIIAGCDDYLSKPVEEAALLQCVQALLSPVKKTSLKSPAETKKIVLLVEDNRDAREATLEILGLLGWHVLEAGSAAEARLAVTERTPSLALVDITLPDMNGYELIEELRQQGLSSTNFITLSGYAADVERGHRAGIKTHLTKPLGLTELEQVLGAMESQT